ncbi:MAG: aldo/keto reductase [Ignavibacteria bacterium]|jgi:predicted aldo/keto reductase-like oxidoreductase|nr:aldo/keto reductase [Ignavibacteria bacterium]
MDENNNNNNSDSQADNNKSADDKKMSRRSALKYLGIGAVGVAAVYCGVKFTPLGEKADLEKSTLLSVIKRKDKVSDAQISLLGFGNMRLPILDENDKGSINEPLALDMIDYAYKNGVNYFDTAWFYHKGMSEPFVGKALKRYPRESFYLATKMPTPAILGTDPNGLVKSTDPLERTKEIFALQLQRCQVEYIDFFFLHSLRSLAQFTESYKDTGGLEYLISEKSNGRIKRLGFSFHGPAEEFPALADQYKWDFCMIQNNYYDWSIDGKFLYDELNKRGIQAIYMEPVRGGMLATLTPQACKVFTDAAPDMSVASWAIRWCASLPNTLNVLSGMSTMEQVVDNVKTMSDFKELSEQDRKVIETALAAYNKTSPIPCTYCDYCVSPPCPAGIHIAEVFRVHNECITEGNLPNLDDLRNSSRDKKEFERSRRIYLGKMNKIPAKQQAVKCTFCRECLPKCPQDIEIADKMQEISTLIKELEAYHA